MLDNPDERRFVSVVTYLKGTIGHIGWIFVARRREEFRKSLIGWRMRIGTSIELDDVISMERWDDLLVIDASHKPRISESVGDIVGRILVLCSLLYHFHGDEVL